MSTSTTTSITAGDAVARAHELIPELRERAAQTVLDRRLPVANIEALRRAGALKTIQARRNGGYALGIRSHLDVMSALGRGCGSTAWVAGVVHAHSWMVSHFPEQGQDDIYAANPDAIVSAVIGPRGKATRTADGYRLEGVWPFGSGSERADWLLLGAVVFDENGTEVDQGDFMVPASSVTIKDDWYVSGLGGTGSCTVGVPGIDVPAHRFLSLPGLIMGMSPGAGLHGDDWVQNCAPVPVLTIALCGGAIGIAQQALADFPSVIKGKVIAYTADPQEPHPLTPIPRRSARTPSVHAHPPRRRGRPHSRGPAVAVHSRRRSRCGCTGGRGSAVAPSGGDAQRLRRWGTQAARGCRNPIPRVRGHRCPDVEPDEPCDGRSSSDQQPRPHEAGDEPGDVRQAAARLGTEHTLDLDHDRGHVGRSVV